MERHSDRGWGPQLGRSCTPCNSRPCHNPDSRMTPSARAVPSSSDPLPPFPVDMSAPWSPSFVAGSVPPQVHQLLLCFSAARELSPLISPSVSEGEATRPTSNSACLPLSSSWTPHLLRPPPPEGLRSVSGHPIIQGRASQRLKKQVSCSCLNTRLCG